MTVAYHVIRSGPNHTEYGSCSHQKLIRLSPTRNVSRPSREHVFFKPNLKWLSAHFCDRSAKLVRFYPIYPDYFWGWDVNTVLVDAVPLLYSSPHTINKYCEINYSEITA